MTIDGLQRSPGGRHARDIASAVHELRTPLATVQGFLETLVERGEDIDPDTRAHITRVAHRNAVLLGQRIDALLAYERLATEPELDLVGARLRQVVERVVEDCTGIVSEHRVEVAIDPAIWVVLDHEAIAHVLSNLLSNAARHSPPGSTITVRAREDDPQVWLSVSDRGSGIPAADLPHVFEAFYRGRRQAGQGTGLGLAVVHRYVEMWGGGVDIESTVGQGTTVSVSLERAVTGGTLDLARWVH